MYQQVNTHNLPMRKNYGLLRLLSAGCILLCLMATALFAQENTEDTSAPDNTTIPAADLENRQLRPVRTDSPRHTLATFLRLRDDLEQLLLNETREGQTRASFDRFILLGEQFRALLDLSAVPGASRRELGENTIAFLLDIFGRIELPNLDSVPDEEAFTDESTPATWRIPRTPIRIVSITEGAREGEFLFSGRTIQTAPRFYRNIANLPLRSALEIDSWSVLLPQLTGPMIPLGVLKVMPASLLPLWLDTPRWKVLAVILLIALLVLALILFHRTINGRINNQPGILLRRLLTPVAILIASWLVKPVIDYEINISGTFSTVVDTLTITIKYLVIAWLFWLLVRIIFERVIQSRHLKRESIDTQLLRVSSKTLGVAGAIIIIAAGVQELGLPLYSIVAGLGIGGLAVALAIRPTLENLIGGIILYIDRPIRVGDFCNFGSQTGTVEIIGIRSTKLRALDRTLITVPNSALADMQLINWAKCDRMLITTTIGLRYETDPDQLRYVLVKFREMLHAHPKIDRGTVRVRFAGYGASSLDIGVRVYALTQEWNEFHAIREDIYLRMNTIVQASGSSFAFPSQTLYMARDDGLDKERSELASKTVQSWRKAGKLPFPRFSEDRMDQLEGTLDYPPQGSVEFNHPEDERQEALEPLSSGLDDENEPLSAAPDNEATEKPKRS